MTGEVPTPEQVSSSEVKAGSKGEVAIPPPAVGPQGGPVTDPAVSALVSGTPAHEQVEASQSVPPVSRPSRKKRETKRNRDKSFDQEREPLAGFSPEADETFLVFFNRYLSDLERFSRFKAKENSLEIVSRQCVTQAATFLSSSKVPSKTLRYCETAGGIILGAGVAELIALVQGKTFTAPLIIVTAILIAVGAVMIGMFLGRE